MSDESFDWHAFLGRWQEEWVPRADPDDGPDEDGSAGPFRLGPPAADEAAIRAAEVRLGRRLPPSYRQFLSVSDGWYVEQLAGVYRLGGTADIDWFRDPFGMTPRYEEDLGDGATEEDVLLAGMWRRALRLETESDMSYALLDPGDRDEDGEWALYVYQGWGGELPVRHPSFRAYMEAMYRGFHSTRAADPGFVNATTRAQDARVEEARLLALRGRHEEAVSLLEEASSFGRPHSRFLLQQVRQLLGRYGCEDYGHLAADARLQPEVLPVQAMAPARDGRPGGDDHWLGMMAARGVDREAARTVLDAVRDGTHRYAPPGPWGEAVARAREEARWGAADAAWRILRGALPLWEAPGPSLIAPIGLLADPVLGPLVTPERGREILATPRSGETGSVPEPVADLDPPGLGWLVEPAAGREKVDGFRCVWTEGLDPAGLPALIGADGAGFGVLTDRLGYWRTRGRQGHEDAEPWEDRAAVAVGRTAEGWAFAFDGHARHLDDARFVSPAVAASAHGRAVVVWREPRSSFPGDRPPAFHLSVAERGKEVYAFTVRGGDVKRSGTVPAALEPARLFRPDGTLVDGELRVLEVLHAELGLSLPRFALTEGALPTLTTRSWTRAPREGESFAYLRFTWHRA
ncbi:SMI1/KNR4 family protein [Streptomyces sp. NPDC096136]|uniref:SMI1/KNR4 family protein n=1 Tax=Streptomyces sp. NPDC096136 TaxID=3366076 RepID=UPI0038286283